MKKILVLMATYNGEKYLAEQLESIFQQKDVEVKVLVRDDGSSDNTKKILEEYHKGGKLEWYSGEHLNVSKGYFDLMKKAEGYNCEYYAFADQDDVWDRDKLSIALKQLSEFDYNIPCLYYCGQRLVDNNLNFMANHELNEKRTLKTRFVLSDFAGCTGVFNKALLKEVISFEPEYMLMHDTWILKVCLCLGGNVFIDSKPHMNYRQHGGNTVGLGRSIPAYVKQVKQYIFKYQVERQMRELRKGYATRMVKEYDELSYMICNYRSDRKCRNYLLNKQNIDFHNKGLNFTYWLKVCLDKL